MKRHIHLGSVPCKVCGFVKEYKEGGQGGTKEVMPGRHFHWQVKKFNSSSPLMKGKKYPSNVASR